MRWVLPFQTPLREFIDPDIAVQAKYLTALKKRQLASNTDLLEVGRNRAGRVRLTNTTGIPITFVAALVHKADISRLAYVRGKTVQHLCGGGYDTLEKIAAADLAEMEQKMDIYYRTLGKSIANFKSVFGMDDWGRKDTPVRSNHEGILIMPRPPIAFGNLPLTVCYETHKRRRIRTLVALSPSG